MSEYHRHGLRISGSRIKSPKDDSERSRRSKKRKTKRNKDSDEDTDEETEDELGQAYRNSEFPKKEIKSRHKDKKYTTDDFYLVNPKYILIVVFVHLYLLVFSLWYSIIGTITETQDVVLDPASTGETHADSDTNTHIHLNTDTIAGLCLITVTLVFILSTFLKWTRPIYYDQAIIIVAVWILIGMVFRYGCICCVDPAPSSTSSASLNATMTPPKPADKIVLELNGSELVVIDSICKNVTLINVFYNIILIILGACLYIPINNENDVHKLIGVFCTSKNKRINVMFLWKLIPLIIFTLVVFIPFECNNPTKISKEEFMLRVALFSVILLLRKTNGYSKDYFIKKMIRVYTDRMNKYNATGLKIFQQGDDYDMVPDFSHLNAIANRHNKRRHKKSDKRSDDETEDEGEEEEEQILVVNSEIIKNIRSHINKSTYINGFVDCIASSVVLFLCGYFLLISIAQFFAEFAVLYFNIKKYQGLLERLQALLYTQTNV